VRVRAWEHQPQAPCHRPAGPQSRADAATWAAPHAPARHADAGAERSV